MAAEHIETRKSLEGLLSAANAKTAEEFAKAYLQFNDAKQQQGESPVYANEFAKLSLRGADQKVAEAKAKAIELREAARRGLLKAQEAKSVSAVGGALADAVNANYLAETVAKFTPMLTAIGTAHVSGNGSYGAAQAQRAVAGA